MPDAHETLKALRASKHDRSYSRAIAPRFQRPRERGRQTTAILVTSPAAFRRPRAVCCRAEGAMHSVSEPPIPPCRVHRRAIAFGIVGRLRSGMLSAAAGGRPCVSLLRAHSLESTAPASAASFTARQADDRKIRCLNRAPSCPASDAQLMRPSVGQGVGSMGEARGARTSSASDPNRTWEPSRKRRYPALTLLHALVRVQPR